MFWKRFFPYLFLYLILWVLLCFEPVIAAEAALQKSSAAELESERLAIYDEISSLRRQYRREELIIDASLTSAAQRQAEYLASIGKLDKQGEFGEDARTRARDAGYGGTGFFEVYEAQALVWVDTDAHYLVRDIWKEDQISIRPLMNEASRHIGIGIADRSDKRRFVVAMLGSLADGGDEYETQPTYDFRTPKPELSFTPTLAPLTVSTPCEDGGVYHVVQSGETLSEIALAYNLDWYTLSVLNNIKMGTNTPAVVYEGDTLVIRPTFTFTPTPTASKTPRPDTSTPRPTFTLSPTRTPAVSSGEMKRPGLVPALEHLLPIFRSYQKHFGILLIALCVPGLLLAFFRKK